MRTYSSHLYALSLARFVNKTVGWKKVKIVVVDHRFMVVDHTWERND